MPSKDFKMVCIEPSEAAGFIAVVCAGVTVAAVSVAQTKSVYISECVSISSACLGIAWCTIFSWNPFYALSSLVFLWILWWTAPGIFELPEYPPDFEDTSSLKSEDTVDMDNELNFAEVLWELRETFKK